MRPQSPKHWTTREFLVYIIFDNFRIINRILWSICYKKKHWLCFTGCDQIESHWSRPTKYLGLRFSPQNSSLCLSPLLQLMTFNHPCQCEESGAVYRGLHQGILWLSSSWHKSTSNHFSLTLSVPQRHQFVSAPLLLHTLLLRFLHV